MMQSTKSTDSPCCFEIVPQSANIMQLCSFAVLHYFLLTPLPYS